MTSLLVLNDPHIADRPPLGRMESYCEDIFAKLVEVRNLATGADAVVCTGDLYHVKRAPHVSHALVQRLITLFRSFPCPVYVLPGNHDLSEEGLASINRQPLGVLAQAGVIKLLDGKDGRTLYPIEPDIVLVARPFDVGHDTAEDYYALTRAERAYVAQQHPGAAVVVCTHGSIIPPGETRPYPYVGVDFIDFAGIDLMLGSHIHEYMGIHEVGSGFFANLGSLGRIARTSDSMTREIVVLWVSTGPAGGPPLTFEEIPITSARPALEVFIARADDEAIDIFGADGFADSVLASLEVEEMSVADLIATLASDLPAGVKCRLEKYLSDAGL